MKKIVIIFILVYASKIAVAQVNLQTGSATFSLPMFSWQDDKSRLYSVIALNYNSGNGLKVADVSSNIGQGWSLITGGFITRMQSGEPDDQKPRDGIVSDITKYPPGYLYNTVDAADGCPGAMLKYPIFHVKNQVYKENNPVAADRELDQFAFQINGRNGIFSLGKNNGNKGVLIGDSRLKIWYTMDESMINQGIRTTINAFFIQDENGLIYKFNQKELTKVTKTKYCDADAIQSLDVPQLKAGNVYHESSFDVPSEVVNPYVVNSWYLSQIEDALTHRVIDITYEIHNITATAGTNMAYYAEKNYAIISHNKSYTQTPTIASINFPDGHLVNFTYGKNRVDLNGDKVLTAVDIKYNDRYLSRYELNNTYFIRNRYGEPISDYEKKSARLCLQSVKKIGIDLKADENPYEFDYNIGSTDADANDAIVPPPFTVHKDIWGFYNGDNNKASNGDYVPYDREEKNLNLSQIFGFCYEQLGQVDDEGIMNPKKEYAKLGLLKKITYPTGATLAYTYEQNNVEMGGQSITMGGVHVSQTSATDGGGDNDCTNPIITTYAYQDVENPNKSSLWGVEKPLNHLPTSYVHYEPEWKRYHWGIRNGCFPFGCCKYYYTFPGIQSREQAISLTARQKSAETISLVMDVMSAVFTVLDIITVCGLGTGNYYLAIVSLIIDVVLNLYNILYTCTADYSELNANTVYYNSNIKSGNSLPAQYKEVTITQGDGSNGKTIQEFTSQQDYPIWESENSILSSKQRFAYWAYGLPKKTSVYDANNYLVRQTENEYNYKVARMPYMIYEPESKLQFPSCKCLPKQIWSKRNDFWSRPELFNPPNTPNITQSDYQMGVEKYGVISGHVTLDFTYDRVYKPNDPNNFLETRTAYGYGPNFLPTLIETYQSNGDINRKYIEYSDASTSSLAATLSQNNIITVPLASRTELIKPGSTTTILEAQKIELTTLANGDIKPFKTNEYTTNNPTGTIGTYRTTQTLTYDANSNVVGMKDEGNRTVTNIYDYNDKYVVASVINADIATDKAFYTSFETSSLGGFSLNTPPAYSNSAITGSRSLVLSGNTITANPLTNAKNNRLSFWSNNILNVTGATLQIAAPTINGFTYYEYSIPLGTNTINITGIGNIDELRLYPQTARMRTVTYDPLIGKTAECDENNHITYYEYDELARLRFIKDDKHNTVKMYEYNVATKPTLGKCASIYYNNRIEEYFSKNDCINDPKTDYQGESVLYTIPYAQYSSTISQQYVDLQAQNELYTNGQAFANAHGTCTEVIYNTIQSQDFTKEGCPVGEKGSVVNYMVPAMKYTSLISQTDANQKALDEISSNGQGYANTHGSCLYDTDPDWIGTGQENCLPNHHHQTQVIDQNPHSSTYNQTQWVDDGENRTLCP